MALTANWCMKKGYSFFVALLLVPLLSWGGVQQDIRVLTMQDGLPDNTVSCMHQDQDGFIWFGTNNGLCRYNGVRMNSFTMPGYYLKLRQIEEAPNGHLWIIGNATLRLFNRHKEHFVPIHWQDTEPYINALTVVNDSTAYALDKSGSLLEIRLSTQGLTNGTEGYSGSCLNTYTSQELQCGGFLHLEQLNDNTLLLATDTGELLFFRPKDRKILKNIHWSHNYVEDVLSFRYFNNTVWIGTLADGLYTYSLATEEMRHFNFSTDKTVSQLSHTDVYGIIPISKVGVLLTTWNGYTLFTPKTHQPNEYNIQIFDHYTSPILQEIDSRMLCGCYSTDDMLWIGTFGGGVVQMNLRKPFYQQYHQESHNAVNDMALDNEGHLWLATFHRGMMRSRTPFTPNAPLELQEMNVFPPSLAGNPPTHTFQAVIKNADGSFWLGGEKATLIHYYPTRDMAPEMVTGLPQNTSILSLFKDKQGRLWVGAQNGLYLFNPVKGQFTHCIKDVFVRAITQDAQDQLWVGTKEGLYRYIPGFALKENTYHDYESRYKLQALGVRSLLYSKQKLLYVGYDDGLGIYDPAKDSLLQFYNTRNGLCSNFIECVLQDKDGQIWLGSNSAISSYGEQEQLFNHYYISTNNGSALALDNCLIWGNNKSLTYFDPHVISETTAHPKKAYITSLDINNAPVQIGQEINGQVILEQPIIYTSSITLNQRNYRFSVSFSDLSYQDNGVRFAYRLTPREVMWNYIAEGQKISFSRLPKGTYKLEVRTADINGVMGPCTTLDVVVLPRWYQTFWAHALYLGGLLLATALILLRNRNENRRKAHEESLRQEITRINQERAQEEVVFQERANFFNAISHELRTPLTLIIAPLQDLLKDPNVPLPIQQKMALIQQHANTLSTTVDQFLQLQKMESGMSTLQRLDTDMVALEKEVIASFSDLVKMKRLSVVTRYDTESLIVNVDTKKMQSAISNLVSNAIKYTLEGGRIEVHVREENVLDNPCCQIIIKDNGVGIKKEYLPHLFDSFTTTPNIPSISTQVGLGLKIVKNTLDLHHGKIDVETEEGKGTCFTLSIPLGDTHFANDTHSLGTSFAAQTVGSLAHKPSSSETKKRLLIIEDNVDVHNYLATLFADTYDISHAFNGAEGVEKALLYLPHLIICDVMMPVKDGFTCSRELKANPVTSHIPIILLTARTEDEDIIKGTQIGIDDYLLKPFNPEVLVAKVDNLMRQRDALKRIYAKALLTTSSKSPSEADEITDSFMQNVINTIELHFTDPDFSVKKMADILCMSQPTLYRKVKAATQLSIIEVIRKVRISKAASLLLEKRFTVQEVAEKVGYNDLGSFRRHFVEQFGVQPGKF